MLEAGATRLGTSSGLWIMQQAREKVEQAGSGKGGDKPGMTRLYTDDSEGGGY
jgi:deoxyribose-phosphate aldolase